MTIELTHTVSIGDRYTTRTARFEGDLPDFLIDPFDDDSPHPIDTVVMALTLAMPDCYAIPGKFDPERARHERK